MKYTLLGIKGSGMSHLASYLTLGGNAVEGLDVEEDFFTSTILKDAPVHSLESPLPEGTDVLVYSTSYEKRKLPAFEEARDKGIPTLTYPEMLARLSKERITVGIAGTHGKSTTCAVASHLAQCASLDAGSIYGSFLQRSDSAYHRGDRGLIIEACEYQDHYQLYDLDVLVITSISFDHPDYFEDLAAVRRSFRDRIVSLKSGATVIYHDSLSRLAKDWASERPDLVFIPYGPKSSFSLSKGLDGNLSVNGVAGTFTCPDANNLIQNDYLGGLLATSALSLLIKGASIDEAALAREADGFIAHLSTFPGLVARGEVLMEEGGVLYIDDYAHHPEEMRVCVDNIRRKWPSRRLVVLFMPHTASRTRALMKDFVAVLSHCDAVFVQHVYAARSDSGDESARELAKRLERKMLRTFYGRLATVGYCQSDEEAVLRLAACLMDGDILLTLGAGDNRRLAWAIAKARS